MVKTLKSYAILWIITFLFFSMPVFADGPAADDSKDAPKEVLAADPVKSSPEPINKTSESPSNVKPKSEMETLKEQIKRLEDKLSKMDEENDIRRRLETTEEEKTSSDEAILAAAGRDYTLMKPGSLGFEYSINYSGATFDSLDTTSDPIAANKNAYHTVTNTFFIEYPVKDNLTMTSSIPYVYKLNSTTNTTAKDVNDLGDVTFGFQFQPVKSGGDFPSLIISGSLSCPTGRSPYKIDTNREISTGSGVYSVGMGCNLSKSVDPLVAFGGFNIEHGIETSHLNYKSGPLGEAGIYLAGVEPGMTYSVSMGIGYSLSYQTSLTLSYQYSYQTKTHYDWVGRADRSSEGTISSIFSVGTGWNISPKQSVNIRMGIGLTNNDSDFSLQVRVPFSYEL